MINEKVSKGLIIGLAGPCFPPSSSIFYPYYTVAYAAPSFSPSSSISSSPNSSSSSTVPPSSISFLFFFRSPLLHSPFPFSLSSLVSSSTGFSFHCDSLLASPIFSTASLLCSSSFLPFPAFSPASQSYLLSSSPRTEIGPRWLLIFFKVCIVQTLTA